MRISGGRGWRFGVLVNSLTSYSNFIKNQYRGTGEVTWWVKHLQCKQEDGCSDSQHLHNSWAGMTTACNPSTWEAEMAFPRAGFLVTLATTDEFQIH